MVASNLTVAAVTRLKREDCKRTKHDSHFSNWKILVGPSDWEDYSVGKEGAEKYRLHNLPKKESSGVYELGIAVLRSGLGREIGKLDPDNVVPVYLGQADNVRTRLQQYGRSGAHLGNGFCSAGSPSDHVQKGPGLFVEILSRGYPIVYRWAPMENKSDALKTETQLLTTFDYAWNTSINGARRPDDVLRKIKKVTTARFANFAQKLLPRQKKVGIRIESSKVPSTEDNFGANADRESNNPLLRIFKFGRSQPRLVLDRSGITQENTIICGVTGGDGSICRRTPVSGRKRCAEHKGMRINGSSRVGVSNSNAEHKGMRIDGSVRVGASNSNVSQCSASSYREFGSHDAPKNNHATIEILPVEVPVSERYTLICGFILADGSPCRRHPIKERKRCDEHKGRRIQKPKSKSVKEVNLKYMHDLASEPYASGTLNYDWSSSALRKSGEVQPQVLTVR